MFRRLPNALLEEFLIVRKSIIDSENYERTEPVYALKCPLCGKKMSSRRETTDEGVDKQELIYFCDQHGAMNKLPDLKEKADQVANKA